MIGPIDIFFSHHTDSCGDIVKELADKLDSSYEITSWYAQRDIRGAQNYTKILPEAIANCTLFVLLLNEFSLKSRQVAREINIAIDKSKPILIVNLDGSPIGEDIVYVSAVDSQIVYIEEVNNTVLVQKIAHKIFEWFQADENSSERFADYTLTNYKLDWEVNDLEFFGDEGERARINLQHQFIYKFAKEEYDKLLSNISDAKFLDVGCNTGAQTKMFLEDKNLKYYIGIDREEAALKEAANTFPHGRFYLCDCEAEDFSDTLSQIEKELGISGFDVINVSMLLLHTKKPDILVDILSEHLSDNGQLIILDIDDGFNIAYPDPNGIFEKAIHLCFKTEYSGYRHSGRAINKFLSDVDLQDIKLHKIGLSNIGMSRKEREEFFDIYFWFILDDLKKMHESNVKDAFLKADYDWLKSNYVSMKNYFKKRDFFFNLGFVLYSAKN